MQTLGPEEHIAIALFLLAEKSCQANEKSNVNTAEFGSDLVNSFPLTVRLKVKT